jgi:glutamate racemase
MNAKPIAVFDSGVGGISVLRELVRLMPQENFIYFGDSANAPYGSRTHEQVQALTLAAADMLIRRGIKALVVACNTATAAAISLLRETYPDTVIIGIEPALKLAADRFPEGRVGIMATEVTLREEKLALQLKRFPGVQADLIAAPGLVELIEAGKADSPETEALLETVLSPYIGKLDALVLGCTHYPFAAKAISRVLGDTTLLDGSEGTARQTLRCLEQKNLLHPGPGSVQIENSLHSPEILRLSMALLEEDL